MTRTILDRDLQVWEAYATSGDFGLPAHARMVFHCLSDMTRKARVAPREGTKAEVEREVASLSAAQLAEILGSAEELQ